MTRTNATGSSRRRLVGVRRLGVVVEPQRVAATPQRRLPARRGRLQRPGGGVEPAERAAVAAAPVVAEPGPLQRRRLGPDRLDGQDAPALLGELGARLRV